MKRLLPALLLACTLGVSLAACDKLPGKQDVSFQNTDVTGLDYAKGFTLTDHTGKQRTLADFKGKAVVVFFGYTQCPDVCPTTMAEMASVMQKLGPQADQVQVVFITVDPERDTQELLASYVPAFDKRFIGLRGTSEQTAKVAKDFKVYYEKVPGTEPGSYTINHMAGSFIFDKDGRVRLFVRHGTGADAIVHDLRQLLS